MTRHVSVLVCVAAASLCGCGSMTNQEINASADEAALAQALGRPSARRSLEVLAADARDTDYRIGAEDLLEIVRAECETCHPDHHLYQKALLTGEAVEGVPGTPALMAAVRTNCLACHVKEETDAKGQKILRSSPVASVIA